MPDYSKMPTPEEVNFYHLAADKDAGSGALHHTLGLGSSQASPGNHRHDGRDSRRVQLKDLESVSISYTPEGGTTGTQPTFSGPAISGSYTKWGNLAHFEIKVDFTNVTSFGTGQYYLDLPFAAEHAYQFRDGCLHDQSTTRQYTISGHVAANANRLYLFTTDSQGNRIFDAAFTNAEPITLGVADSFHVAGTYEIKQ
jgi:hypothetical protein